LKSRHRDEQDDEENEDDKLDLLIMAPYKSRNKVQREMNKLRNMPRMQQVLLGDSTKFASLAQ